MSNHAPSALIGERISSQQQLEERRKRERLKLCLPLYVRPLRSSGEQIEEVTTTIDFNRNGLSFTTSHDHYRSGMSLFLTFPYSADVTAHVDYVGEVVRVTSLPNGDRAVAVQFLFCPR